MTGRHLIFAVLISLMFGCVLAPVTALNITADSGETWIEWKWNTSDPVTVMIDGVQVINNSVSPQFYYLHNINPSERHYIQIYNGSGVSEPLSENTAASLVPMVLVLCVLFIAILFMVLLLLQKNVYRAFVCGVLCIITSFFLTQISAGYIFGISLVGIILIVISGVLVIWSYLDMKQDED